MRFLFFLILLCSRDSAAREIWQGRQVVKRVWKTLKTKSIAKYCKLMIHPWIFLPWRSPRFNHFMRFFAFWISKRGTLGLALRTKSLKMIIPWPLVPRFMRYTRWRVSGILSRSSKDLFEIKLIRFLARTEVVTWMGRMAFSSSAGVLQTSPTLKMLLKTTLSEVT